MLIITRYSRGPNSAYHSIGALEQAIAHGGDMISLPVRTTSDKHLVLTAKASIGSKASLTRVRSASLKQIRRCTAGTKRPIVTLDGVLKKLYGATMIEIEIYEWSAASTLVTLLKNYAKRKSDWSSLLITSENPLLLMRVRKLAPHALLCLKHGRYPLTFATWQPVLGLSAVGFRRMSLSTVAVEAARKLDLLIYVHTVNRPKSLKILEKSGVDAVVTDTPEKLIKFTG